MPKKTDEVTEALAALLQKVELDSLLYKLTEIAYARRNAEDHKDGNKAEYSWWHQAAGILSDATDKIGEIQ